MHINVPAVRVDKLTREEKAESSTRIQQRVQKAREIQNKRFKTTKIKSNSEMSPKMLKEFCRLDKESIVLLKEAINKLNLSARSFHKVVKIARTVADLESSVAIKPNHVEEALQYRPSDSLP
ncbi:MAG: hypothetical protein COU81_04125 [Candidatus Portnoybacteria bacterium CG10_big_fil_rev_8_21_14_0_10_36_7]|uniref:Mg chelatase-related protein C-terminal domain-containing protein n=1 Tax=Candidatus Portnoybacteria bacterium CG10_big_fil_rev_8_21_14_0_10_36_7 TaxID=1974812 RepID=A0A2M8KCZ3_9BACT|nr:MAG: hypothetical protein COU81_04125 [Candidatus Portnoybacteria bacterium CG10_big_fil_rev_8_21_14_0_10_36_7]